MANVIEPDQHAANVLAIILHHATTAPGGADASSPTQSGLESSLSSTVSSTNQMGQSVIDQATTASAPATPTPSPTTPADTSATSSSEDVSIPAGSDAVGLNNPNVSQGYGGEGGHPGIDLGIPVGTPLLAAETGRVTVAGLADPGGYGNEVEITAPDGTVMRYGHLSGISVNVGDTVKAGQLIGKSGGEAGATGSGNSTGAHLHFEVRVGDHTVDPTPYLAGSTGGIVKGSATANPAAQTATAQAAPDAAGVAGNILDIVAGKAPSNDTTTSPDTTTSSGTQAGTGSTSDSDPGAVDAFLAATKQHESGGNYHIYNQSGQSNASGAYQFLNSTWKGAGGSTEAAAQASPEEQDRVARNMAMNLFNQFHSWRLVAIAWYGGPGVAQQVAAGQNPGSPEGQGPYLAYGDTIQRMMQGGK